MRTVALFGCLLGVAAVACAQPGDPSPLDAATNKLDKPAAIVQAPAQSDALIDRALRGLAGSFRTPAADNADDRPPLILSSAPVSVSGLPNTIYFEIARDSSLWAPFRQGLFHIYRRQGELHLRVFDLGSSAPNTREHLIGLSMAPDAFPPLDLSRLTVNFDIPLADENGTLTGSSSYPIPTTRDGAIEFTTSFRIDDRSITIYDTGFDASGTPVWGSPTARPFSFSRQASAPAPVTRLDGGLIVITLSPPAPDAPKLADGGEVVLHYTGWTTDGRPFDSSRPSERQPDRQPTKFRLFPGTLIKGWIDGLNNIAKGERRRIIIPADLAYGARGSPRAGIPAGATLIFDAECLYVDNTPLPTPPPPAPPSPH